MIIKVKHTITEIKTYIVRPDLEKSARDLDGDLVEKNDFLNAIKQAIEEDPSFLFDALFNCTIESEIVQ